MSISAPFPLLPTPENLHLFKRQYLKESSTPFTPDVVLLLGPDNVRYVLKDFSRRPFIARVIWCRFSVARETAAYRALDTVHGIPRLVGEPGRDSFIMEWLDAQPLPRRKQRDKLGSKFFDKVESVLGEMHQCGVAHGDLRRKNILVSADRMPCIIDFETAVLRGRGLRRKMFNAVCRIDQITVLKIRARYYPEEVTPDQARMLNDAPWHLKLGRFVRQRIYGSLSPKHAQRRAERRLRKVKKRSGT